jgi:hypothetical protein
MSDVSDERKSNNKEDESQKIQRHPATPTVTTPTESKKNPDSKSKPYKGLDPRLLVVRDDIVVSADPDESEENIRRREAIKQVPSHHF